MKRLTFCYIPLPGESPKTFHGDVSEVFIDRQAISFTVGSGVGERITVPMSLIVSPISTRDLEKADAAA